MTSITDNDTSSPHVWYAHKQDTRVCPDGPAYEWVQTPECSRVNRWDDIYDQDHRASANKLFYKFPEDPDWCPGHAPGEVITHDEHCRVTWDGGYIRTRANAVKYIRPGDRFGWWRVIGVVGDRAICQCRCNRLREVKTERLVFGLSLECSRCHWVRGIDDERNRLTLDEVRTGLTVIAEIDSRIKSRVN